MGEPDVVLRRDKPGIGGGKGLLAQVILADPGQSIASQALRIVAHKRFKADVAGLREQHGADADAEVRDPRRAFAHVRERGGKISASGDLEQYLWQLDPRQPRCDGGTQRNQRGGLLDLIEAAQNKLILAVDALEAHRWIVG